MTGTTQSRRRRSFFATVRLPPEATKAASGGNFKEYERQLFQNKSSLCWKCVFNVNNLLGLLARVNQAVP